MHYLPKGRSVRFICATRLYLFAIDQIFLRDILTNITKLDYNHHRDVIDSLEIIIIFPIL